MSLQSQISAFVARVAAENKSLRTLLNGNAQDLAQLTTNNKTDLVTALNEIRALAAGLIDDGLVDGAKTWSSSKIDTAIADALAAVVDASPAALDTLKELSAAIGDDQNFAATVTTALANRLRFDEAQALTPAQQGTACQNIGIGDPAHDFVVEFDAALI